MSSSSRTTSESIMMVMRQKGADIGMWMNESARLRTAHEILTPSVEVRKRKTFVIVLGPRRMPASQERSRGATASRASVSLSSQTKVLPVRCAAGSAMRSPMDAMSPPESRALLPLKVTVSAREYSWFTGTARRGGCVWPRWWCLRRW